MKICAIICEFNPFHNGHRHILEQAKALSGCDRLLCIMSGQFTQRGEGAILDKFTRARHALLSGADCVLELPTPFTVAPAEIFAKGAIKLLSSIPEVSVLAFGSENAQKQALLDTAKVLINESQTFKECLLKYLAEGLGYSSAYEKTLKDFGGQSKLVSSPNNILALEYTKAILSSRANIDILPIQRIGGAYNDCQIKNNFSSASAIRASILRGQLEEVKGQVPSFVFDDFIKKDFARLSYDQVIKYALLNTTSEQLSCITGCNEGLENKILSLRHLSVDDIVEQCSTKRYTRARIRRILLLNALRITNEDTQKYLASPLYIKPLAVDGQYKNEMLGALGKSINPVIVTNKALTNLSNVAKQCYEQCLHADEVWDIVHKTKTYNHTLITV